MRTTYGVMIAVGCLTGIACGGNDDASSSSSSGGGSSSSSTNASTTAGTAGPATSGSGGATTSASGSTASAGGASAGGAPSTTGTTSSSTTAASATSSGTTSSGTTSSGTTSSSSSSSSGGSVGALIENDRFWTDSSGTPIYSQGGGVLKVGDTYYWYGVKYQGAVTYAAAPTKLNSDTTFVAVTAYSSKDLVHWTFENNIVTGETGWFGRLGVVYNATTKKYVLVAQGRGGLYFATSDTPTGKFQFDNVQMNLPTIANGSTGDQTTFQDDDGKAYLICSSSMGRGNLYVSPLRPADFLALQAGTRIFGGAGREGNAMFKYNGHYYFCSSDLHGWNASHTYCISASNITGPYSAEFVLDNTDPDFSHVTQTGFFITVHGSAQSTVIFAGDRWSDFAGNGLGYNQWMPLSFNGTTPHFESLSEWSLDANTGAWSAGPANNFARNPSFEADRVAMTTPAGWTTTTNLTATSPHTNATTGRTGRWYWSIKAASSYQASLDQALTGLPNGTYKLTAWVKSSGGQSSAVLYAKGSGAQQTASLTKAMSGWTQVTVTGIAVTNGQAQIGVQTNAAANQWLNLDDFVLVRE